MATAATAAAVGDKRKRDEDSAAPADASPDERKEDADEQAKEPEWKKTKTEDDKPAS